MSKVIIVGGGISGLTAGIYTRRAGHEVLILEKCATPGGVSTCWKREGYLFEGGVHWLNGSNPKHDLHRIWTETGALGSNNPIYFKDPVYVLKNRGREIAIHRDWKRTLDELIEASPEDARTLRRIFRQVNAFRHFQAPVKGVTSIWSYISMTPSVLLTPFLWMQSIKHYLSPIRSDSVRMLLESVVDPVNNAVTFAYTLAAFFWGDSGYPTGGSLRMALNMAKTFTSEGGVIRYNTAVERVEKGAVHLSGGERLEADAIVITVDARTAIDRLFEKPLQDGWACRMRQELQTSQCMFIGLGVKADLNYLPKSMVYALDEPFEAGGLRLNSFIVNNYARDGYAPEGCTTVTALLPGNSYAWWKAAREDGTYYEKKEDVVRRFIGIIEKIIPEVRGNVAVTDMATPLTVQRYCDTFEGSYMSDWPPRKFTNKAPLRYCKGIYFAGQRTAYSGGLPVAGTTGREVALEVIKDFPTDRR